MADTPDLAKLSIDELKAAFTVANQAYGDYCNKPHEAEGLAALESVRADESVEVDIEDERQVREVLLARVTAVMKLLAQALRDAESEYARVRSLEPKATVLAASILAGEAGLTKVQIEAAQAAWKNVHVALDALLAARAALGETSP